jgi:hypothetical protein
MSPGEDADRSVFICHAAEDREAAEKIRQLLEGAGFRCWIAPRDVRPGRDYATEIIDGIEISRSLVLVLSQRANGSTFVRAEVERAYSKGKPVIPVRIEDVQPSRSLELFISTQDWIDARNGEFSPRDVDLLAGQLASTPFDSQLGTVSSKLRQRILGRRLLRIGAIVAMFALIAIISAVVMRSLKQEIVDVVDTSHPVTVMFIGARIYPNRPFDVSYYLRDGSKNGDQYIGALDHLKSFEVYEATAGPVFNRLYAGNPEQYKGVFSRSKTTTFTLDHVPSIVIACIAYEIPENRQSKISVQAFAFLPPDKLPSGTYATPPPGVILPFKDYGFSQVADFRVYNVAKPDCQGRVEAYAKELMQHVLKTLK